MMEQDAGARHARGDGQRGRRWGVIAFFMALLSFPGISTPSLPAQGEQRRSSCFNIPQGSIPFVKHLMPQDRHALLL
jgi:hypothetical protein